MKDYIKLISRPTLEYSKKNGCHQLNNNEASFGRYARYPYLYPLYNALSEFYKVPTQNMLITYGSEQALDFSFRLLLEEGDSVVSPWPTFGMIPVFAQQNGAYIIPVNYSSSLKISIYDILNAVEDTTRIVYLANPDNPTGSFIHFDEISQLAVELEQRNIHLILDEAYYHYADEEYDAISFLKLHSNIIITRSLSKAWGLAGLRVGFAISSPELIRLLLAFKPMEENTTPSIKKSIRVLSSGRLLKKNVDQVNKWKQKFSQAKLKYSLTYVPTYTNFILIQCDAPGHRNAYIRDFEQMKILMKPLNESPMKFFLRFSIGSDRIMNKILQKLKL